MFQTLAACIVLPPIAARIALTTAFYFAAVVATVPDIHSFGRRNGVDSIMQVLMRSDDDNGDDEDEWQYADGFGGGQASGSCTVR